MSTAPSHPGRPGRPPRLSRAEIVTAARRIIDEEGVAKLTMRRLAKEIGSTPMALYHHVRDKEELLLLLLEDYAGQAPRPSLPADPRERLLAAATAMRDLLARCPWLVEVLTADDLLAPSALWFVEQVVDAAIACGLSPEQAVHAYRSIWYYTAGELIVRATAARRRATDDRPTYRDQVFAGLDPAGLPRLAALGPRWAELTATDTYAAGLRALVDGLLSAGRAGTPYGNGE
ncbi:TetR/AcrR family transcriptional regulator [Streptomyces sp. NPDC014006]|uniref:TetR/AcrR family transcriptional regulator n=1 Tax=Streptomyces sp. NPDC014006 TaxID=3364870 RepID=UPI0037035963